MFMPHSSGQRQGDFRNSLEMSHSVSPRCTVWDSGALGASSDSGYALLRHPLGGAALAGL